LLHKTAQPLHKTAQPLHKTAQMLYKTAHLLQETGKSLHKIAQSSQKTAQSLHKTAQLLHKTENEKVCGSPCSLFWLETIGTCNAASPPIEASCGRELSSQCENIHIIASASPALPAFTIVSEIRTSTCL
jgi:hypothetical protein